MYKLEQKFGKYAIKNLSLIIILMYALGYVISMIPSLSILLDYMRLNPYLVFHGQVWRIFTWVIVPNSSFGPLTLIAMFCFYSITKTLERAWGDFLFNIYFFSGLIFVVLGSFLVYFVEYLRLGDMTRLAFEMYYFGYSISTTYIYTSLLLGFALTFPNTQFLLMFIIPVKAIWIAYADIAFSLLILIAGTWTDKFLVFFSLLNFVIFYLLVRKARRVSPFMAVKRVARRKNFENKINKETHMRSTRHKCATCGRTEEDSDTLEFRYCSKCNGSYEYCQDHLFTHIHVE